MCKENVSHHPKTLAENINIVQCRAMSNNFFLLHNFSFLLLSCVHFICIAHILSQRYLFALKRVLYSILYLSSFFFARTSWTRCWSFDLSSYILTIHPYGWYCLWQTVIFTYIVRQRAIKTRTMAFIITVVVVVLWCEWIFCILISCDRVKSIRLGYKKGVIRWIDQRYPMTFFG